MGSSSSTQAVVVQHGAARVQGHYDEAVRRRLVKTKPHERLGAPGWRPREERKGYAGSVELYERWWRETLGRSAELHANPGAWLPA